jgi:hypothetical protein
MCDLVRDDSVGINLEVAHIFSKLAVDFSEEASVYMLLTEREVNLSKASIVHQKIQKLCDAFRRDLVTTEVQFADF